ncbi:MAG: DUF4340 domain-containing protein [Myxococcaceae bacterium]
MSARSRSLLLALGAAALALALGLYAYYGVLRKEARETAAKAASETLVAPVAQPDGGSALLRYDKLVLTAHSETSELGRLPDASWVLIRPFRARADARTAEDVVSTLQALRLNRPVDEQPKEEDLQRYGLKPPRFVVAASAQGAPALTLFGGVENSFDGSLYVQRGGDARVYAVEGATRSALEKSPEELRARDVLGPRDLGLEAIQLKSARHDWAVAREPEHPWAFQKPPGLSADGGAVSQWVARLAQQRAVKFLSDSPAERKRTGVETPAVDATFRRLKETVRVRLAGGPKETDPAYVLREDSFGVTLAELSGSALSALDVPAAELRDRRLLSFEPSQVETIRILPGGGSPPIVLVRQRADAGATPSWLLASATPQPASTAKVGTLLYTLAGLRWLSADEAPPKDAGLSGHARSVFLADGEGKVVASLVLGKPVSAKGTTVWTRTSSGEVVQVETSRLKALPTRPEEVLETGPAPSEDASH